MEDLLKLYARQEGLKKCLEDWKKNKPENIQKLKAIYFSSMNSMDEKFFDELFEQEYEILLDKGKKILEETENEIRKREEVSGGIIK